jgi:hypothetical protein
MQIWLWFLMLFWRVSGAIRTYPLGFLGLGCVFVAGVDLFVRQFAVKDVFLGVCFVGSSRFV